MTVANNEIQFYDAVEDPDDLDDLEDNPNVDPEVKIKMKELKGKLAVVYRKRAQLRNKRVSWVLLDLTDSLNGMKCNRY